MRLRSLMTSVPQTKEKQEERTKREWCVLSGGPVAGVCEVLMNKEGTGREHTLVIKAPDCEYERGVCRGYRVRACGWSLHVRAVSGSKKWSSSARNVRTTCVLGIGRSYIHQPAYA